MSHPSDETLYAAARGDDLPEVFAHTDRCSACAARLRRLQGGAVAMREAKRSMPDLNWNRLDDIIAREAVVAARDIRVAPPVTRGGWLRPLSLVFAVGAAAAAAVVVMRPAPEVSTPVAQRIPAVSPAPAPRRAVDATVLLSTAGSTLRSTENGPATDLSSAIPHEGARLETAPGARAVLALQPGVTLDLRAESAASLSRIREGESVVTLDRGALRLARNEGNADVSLRAGAWSVRAEGDVLARRELDVIRVVVLAGRASVQREGASALTFSGPVTLELPAEGDARRVGETALDEIALDLSAFRAESALLRVPALDPAAVLSLGDLTLPAGVSTLRVATARPLTARVGRVSYTLDIGTGEVVTWRRLTVVAAREPVAPRPAPRTAPAIAAPEPPDPGLAPQQIQAVARAVGARVRHCFSTCVEQNRCAADEGQLRVNVSPEGSATLAPIPASLEGARRCLEGEVGRFRGTPASAPYAIAIGFNTRR